MSNVLERLTEGVVERNMLAETKAVVDKWSKSGLLEGLKTEREKSTMAMLLENQAKELLREATTMSGGDVQGFAAVAFPIVRRVFAGLIANDFVYIAIAFGLITFLYDQIRYSTKPFLSPLNIRVLITDGLLNLAIPVGLATFISEMISRSVKHARPFVNDGATNFLNHANDGGMPSHHMVFTVALGFCVIGFHRNVGAIILIMSIISGFGRMAAGIHYPTDLIVGFAIGIAVPYLFGKFLAKLKISRKR